MSRLMGTSGAESTSAAAIIFVGQTEAPLLVRPYLKTMTRSEIGAIMTVGFATVAGGVFALYVGMLQDKDPEIAGHLLAATVMSAPIGLGFAKLVFPETEEPETLGRDVVQPKSEYANLVDAAATGAGDGMKLALNIIAMLIAFLALLAVINALLDWVYQGASLEGILGNLLAPLAWLLGVPADESRAVGSLLGVKVAVNEYIAYGTLMGEDLDGLSDRSRRIASYALCGFANFSSIAIQIGGLGAMAPERRPEITRLGLRRDDRGRLCEFPHSGDRGHVYVLVRLVVDLDRSVRGLNRDLALAIHVGAVDGNAAVRSAGTHVGVQAPFALNVHIAVARMDEAFAIPAGGQFKMNGAV